MKTGLRSGAWTLLCMVPVLMTYQACMKKACVTCTTSYPVPLQDTFHIRDSVQYHCDVTIEQEEHMEQRGTKDTVIVVNGRQYAVRILTDCK
jgi:hypothetical protein